MDIYPIIKSILPFYSEVRRLTGELEFGYRVNPSTSCECLPSYITRKMIVHMRLLK